MSPGRNLQTPLYIFLFIYCNKAIPLLYMSTRLTSSNKEARCMASREAPLPDGKESIFTGHGKEGLSRL